MSSLDYMPSDEAGWTDRSDWSTLLCGSDPSEMPPAAAESVQLVLARAEAAERERDRLIEDVRHLRAQLDAGREEIQRRDHAEAELRRLLLSAHQLARELAQQLEQKALPVGPAELPAPMKRNRWALFARR
jgi:7-keto-8-aminopelargonate synthetase-like enzyme